MASGRAFFGEEDEELDRIAIWTGSIAWWSMSIMLVGAIAILARRVMTGQIGAAKMLPGLLGLAQAEVSDQAIELADAQDVGRAGRSRLRQVAFRFELKASYLPVPSDRALAPGVSLRMLQREAR